MSTENIPAFHARVAGSPELQARLAAIRHRAVAQVATELSHLATEVGLPFTAEEFLATVPAPRELSEQDLAAVAGGGISSIIVKKEHVSDSYLNLWGFWGEMHTYTTDSGKIFSGSTNYEIGQTYTPHPHYPAK